MACEADIARPAMLRNWIRHELSYSNPSFCVVIVTLPLQSFNVLLQKSKDIMNKCRAEEVSTKPDAVRAQIFLADIHFRASSLSPP